jgi:hypothetical protein
MRDLIEGAGLKILDAHFVEAHPKRTELAAFWKELDPVTAYVLRRDAWSDVCQMVADCVPEARPGTALEPETLTPRALDRAMGRPSLRIGSKSVRRWLAKLGIMSRGR